MKPSHEPKILVVCYDHKDFENWKSEMFPVEIGSNFIPASLSGNDPREAMRGKIYYEIISTSYAASHPKFNQGHEYLALHVDTMYARLMSTSWTYEFCKNIAYHLRMVKKNWYNEVRTVIQVYGDLTPAVTTSINVRNDIDALFVTMMLKYAGRLGRIEVTFLREVAPGEPGFTIHKYWYE